MPKKKKTLKQKLQADQRRQTPAEVTVVPQDSTPRGNAQEQESPAGVSFSLPTSHIKTPTQTKRATQATAVTINTNEYAYLSKDLVKTGLLTLLIVIAELVIKFFFERG